jgi:hypothetical protein
MPVEEIIGASETQLEQDLAERLRVVDNPTSERGECFEPLGSMLVEAVLWVGAATLLWITAALWAQRS